MVMMQVLIHITRAFLRRHLEYGVTLVGYSVIGQQM